MHASRQARSRTARRNGTHDRVRRRAIEWSPGLTSLPSLSLSLSFSFSFSLSLSLFLSLSLSPSLSLSLFLSFFLSPSLSLFPFTYRKSWSTTLSGGTNILHPNLAVRTLFLGNCKISTRNTPFFSNVSTDRCTLLLSAKSLGLMPLALA